MKIAVCDDDLLCRQQVLDYINFYTSQNGSENLFVSSFCNAEDLLESAKKVPGFDICFLDIIMPGMNGIELGKNLRELGFDGKIVYLTSSEEFAVDSYRVKAFNYILKPIDKAEFISVFDEAIKSLSKNSERYIVVKTKQGSVKIAVGNIMYAELSRRIIVYHLINGKTVESVSLRTTFSEAIRELIYDGRFALCGTSTVVNLCHITTVENEGVTFRETYKIYPSKKSCRELRSRWCDYLFNGGAEK